MAMVDVKHDAPLDLSAFDTLEPKPAAAQAVAASSHRRRGPPAGARAAANAQIVVAVTATSRYVEEKGPVPLET